MYKRRLILAIAAWLCVSAAVRADSIVKSDGQSTGDVVEMTAEEVTIELRGKRTKVPVNQIQAVRYSEEPARLNTARQAIKAGRYEDAVTGLETIKVDEIKRAEVKQDVQFYTALAMARIALAGTDSKVLVEARDKMFDFAKKNRLSYHFFEACEVLGDLYVAGEEHEEARGFYNQLAQAPWPDYKMRAGVALGRALLAEGKAEEALFSFEEVLKTEAQGESADLQRLAATLGKARCLAEAGQSDEAVKLVNGVIAKANTEEVQLHARAYNALGMAHRKAGRAQDALLAYLHVTELYFTSPKEHIEALENLVELWNEVHQPERADKARDLLQERYNRSPRSN